MSWPSGRQLDGGIDRIALPVDEPHHELDPSQVLRQQDLFEAANHQLEGVGRLAAPAAAQPAPLEQLAAEQFVDIEVGDGGHRGVGTPAC